MTATFFQRWNSLLVVLGLFLHGEALAQPIDTNRPGFSFTTGIVGKGQWQLETGIIYSRFDDKSNETSLPLAELRTGVSSRAEVFLTSVSWTRTSLDDTSVRGIGDFVVGTKFRISAADSKTQLALVFQTSVPTGDSDVTSDRWNPGAAFVWSYGSRLPILGTVKITDFGTEYQVDNGIWLTVPIGDTRSVFFEWEANLPEKSGDTHWLNAGYLWLPQENIQIDINAGLGLNDLAGDYRVGVGFSIRL